MKPHWGGVIDEGGGPRPVFCVCTHGFGSGAYSDVTRLAGEGLGWREPQKPPPAVKAYLNS